MTSKYVDGIHEERFDQFLTDLRSGEFNQGSHTLELDGKFCCLGLACVRPHSLGLVERSESLYTGTIRYGNTSVDMPVEVADYLGIPSDNRTGGMGNSTDIAFFKQGYEFSETANRHTAIGWNDALKKTFPEIADAFEQEFTRE